MANLKINPNDRIQVKNMRDWSLSFELRDSNGGIQINPNATIRMLFSEVEVQASTPGSFFYGTDGLGNGAAIRIVDDAVRAYIFGTGAAEKQTQIDLDSVKALLNITPLSAFEKAMKAQVVTDGDKRMLARLAIAAGLNDVAGGAGKKKSIEKYAGYTIVEEDTEE